MDYILSCSSTADLGKDYLDKRGVPFARFTFNMDGKDYEDDGIAYPIDDFYKAIRNGAKPTTSQVNVEKYTELFEPFLKEGKDILHLTLSSGISGTYNSAVIAADDLREKYPERKIYIVDSLDASSGYGLLVDTAKDLKDSGMGIDELYKWVLENRLKVNHWVMTGDLTHLYRGGRISATSMLMGNLLNICPLIRVDAGGKLAPFDKIRGKKKAIKALVDKMEEACENGTAYDDKCFIAHSDCLEDAKELKNEVEERFPALKGKTRIFNIGTVIGSHTGPGTVVVFHYGKARTD